MHISKVSLVNYRNFERTSVHLGPGVNTLIGENGSGKSNLFLAIRLLLDESLVGRVHEFKESDFHRGLGDWRGHWIVIMLEFGNVSKDESVQSLLLQHTAEEKSGEDDRATYTMIFRPKDDIRDSFAGLANGDRTGFEAIRNKITIDDYERCLFGKMSADLTDPDEYKRVVGDFDSVIFPKDENGYAPSFWGDIGVKVQREMSLWREFSLSYVPALRNVVADFNDNRKNPLRTLLRAQSEEIPEGDFDEIIEQVRKLNASIEERDDVQEITRGIQQTFKDTVGETFSPTSMRIQSELPLDASDLFQSLKLYVGENDDSAPRRLHEMSLGGANLVYLTLKLLEFQYRTARKVIANFLLIEEPEAHIHTHVQKTLFDRVSYDKTQIIYSTHSTHISEVSEIGRVNVLSRENKAWVALQPSAGLEDKEIEAAQRFLDAIRCNLLFARSVLLVEGDAEEILVPNLIKSVYGISLDEIGISLINVRSTNFKNLANLFDVKRLRKNCAIITDHDQTFFDVQGMKGDKAALLRLKKRARASAVSGALRKENLDAYVIGNSYVHVAYAPHTFEVDFANTAQVNRMILAGTVDAIYTSPALRKRLKGDLAGSSVSIFGQVALKLANRAGKGWFALLVAGQLDSADFGTGAVIPNYLLDALGFSAGKLPIETWARIIEHRIGRWELSGAVEADKIKAGHQALMCLKDSSVTLSKTLDGLQQTHPDPQLLGLAQAFGV